MLRSEPGPWVMSSSPSSRRTYCPASGKPWSAGLSFLPPSHGSKDVTALPDRRQIRRLLGTDRVERVRLDRVVLAGITHDVHRVTALLDRPDLALEHPPKRDDAPVGGDEVLEVVDGDGPLPFLRLHVVGPALPVLVRAVSLVARPNLLAALVVRHGVGARSPCGVRLAVHQGPRDDAEPHHVRLVRGHR